MIPFHPQPRSTLHRAGAVALLLVLVLAQTLGWIHRGLHGSDGPALQAPLAVQAHLPAGDAESAGGWLGDLFGDHTEASDCRLFDAVAQPACASAGLLAVAVLLPAASVAALHASFIARATPAFQARGPPLSR